MGALDKLENFACHFGRQFYGLKQKEGFEDRKVTLVKEENVVVPANYQVSAENPQAGAVVPFLANKDIGWKISQNFC